MSDISENIITAYENAGFTVHTNINDDFTRISMHKDGEGVVFIITDADMEGGNVITALRTKINELKTGKEEEDAAVTILDELYEVLENLSSE